MGYVENQRRAGAAAFHHAEAEHIDHQIVVAELAAALAQHHVFIAGFFEFFNDIAHLLRTEKLRFFHVDDAAGGGHCPHQVGLAGEKGGQLQHVAHFGHGGALVGFVHVGQHRHAEFAFDGGKNLHAFVQPHSAIGMHRRAVGFVKRGFENEGNAEFFGNAHIMGAGAQGGIKVFEHVDAAKQGDGALVGNGDGVDGNHDGSF